MEKIRAALIGCGHIHSLHTRAIAVLPHVEIVAVCDEIKERAEKTAEEFSCRVYTDWKEMCQAPDIDVIHIATPHYLHAPMAIYAMEQGKHVLTEKPMAIKYEDALAMNEAARKTGKTLGVIFQNRTNPGSVLIKETLESGKLGKVLCAKCALYWDRPDSYYAKDNWHGTWEREGGGVLMNQSIHTLDLMYYLCGDFKTLEGSVALRRNKDVIEVEDTAEATIIFENGIEGIFYATNCNFKDSSVQVELFFEKASFLLYKDALYIHGKNGLEMLVNNSDYTKTEGKACWGNGHVMMMTAFYNAIQGGDDYYCDVKDAVPVLKMIGEIYNTSANKLR